MGAVLPFPRRRRRRRSPSNTATLEAQACQLNIFPPARHRTIVDTIVREMLEHATEDDAAEVLTSHLYTECHRLDAIGIGDQQIEAACEAFATAAWKQFYRGEPSEGVA